MARSARPAGRALAFTTALGFLGAGLLSWQMLSPERGLESSFRNALTASGRAIHPDTIIPPLQPRTFGAGLWLSGLEPQQAHPGGRSMDIGSQVLISGRDGQMRHLEVVDVRPIGNRLHGLDAAPPAAMLLVTLRPVGQAAGGEIRLLIEAGDEETRPAAPARTL